jgi:hypothetical protein
MNCTTTNAPAGDATRATFCNCINPCVVCNCNATPKIQPPKMGTALRSFLKRYASDLIPLAKSGDKIASRMIDGCNNLLIESDRLEGESYE